MTENHRLSWRGRWSESFVRLTWESFLAVVMDEGVVMFLAFSAPVEARTLLGEVTWSKAIETELIWLDCGHHLVSRKGFKTSADIQRVFLILTQSTIISVACTCCEGYSLNNPLCCTIFEWVMEIHQLLSVFGNLTPVATLMDQRLDLREWITLLELQAAVKENFVDGINRCFKLISFFYSKG